MAKYHKSQFIKFFIGFFKNLNEPKIVGKHLKERFPLKMFKKSYPNFSLISKTEILLHELSFLRFYSDLDESNYSFGISTYWNAHHFSVSYWIFISVFIIYIESISHRKLLDSYSFYVTRLFKTIHFEISQTNNFSGNIKFHIYPKTKSRCSQVF